MCCRVLRRHIGAPRFVENGLSVASNLLGDKRKGCRLGPTAIFYRGTDHAARIADEIGQDEDIAAGEHLFGLCRQRDVGALGDDPGLQPRDVIAMDDIRPCRGDPDIAGDVDHRLHAELVAARMIVQRSPFGL